MFLLKSQFNYKIFRILSVLTGEKWSELPIWIYPIILTLLCLQNSINGAVLTFI